MVKPEIVPLTREHLIEWYGATGNGPTVKGIAGLIDGNLVALAGLMFNRGNVVVFCDLKDEARPYKATIHRTAVRLINEAKRRHKRLLAVCDDNEPTAKKWLSRLGFRPDEGNVWTWLISD